MQALAQAKVIFLTRNLLKAILVSVWFGNQGSKQGNPCRPKFMTLQLPVSSVCSPLPPWLIYTDQFLTTALHSATAELTQNLCLPQEEQNFHF